MGVSLRLASGAEPVSPGAAEDAGEADRLGPIAGVHLVRCPACNALNGLSAMQCWSCDVVLMPGEDSESGTSMWQPPTGPERTFEAAPDAVDALHAQGEAMERYAVAAARAEGDRALRRQRTTTVAGAAMVLLVAAAAVAAYHLRDPDLPALVAPPAAAMSDRLAALPEPTTPPAAVTAAAPSPVPPVVHKPLPPRDNRAAARTPAPRAPAPKPNWPSNARPPGPAADPTAGITASTTAIARAPVAPPVHREPCTAAVIALGLCNAP